MCDNRVHDYGPVKDLQNPPCRAQPRIENNPRLSIHQPFPNTPGLTLIFLICSAPLRAFRHHELRHRKQREKRRDGVVLAVLLIEAGMRAK